MKKFLLFLFLVITSCTSNNVTYTEEFWVITHVARGKNGYSFKYDAIQKIPLRHDELYVRAIFFSNDTLAVGQLFFTPTNLLK